MTRHRREAGQGPEPLGPERDRAVPPFDDPLDHETARAGEPLPRGAEEPGLDDRLGDAGLVLEGEEEHPLRGAGALADDHRAGGADALAVRQAGERGGRNDPARREAGAEVGERVAPRTWMAVLCAVVGIALFSLSKPEHAAHMEPALGAKNRLF